MVAEADKAGRQGMEEEAAEGGSARRNGDTNRATGPRASGRHGYRTPGHVHGNCADGRHSRQRGSGG